MCPSSLSYLVRGGMLSALTAVSNSIIFCCWKGLPSVRHLRVSADQLCGLNHLKHLQNLVIFRGCVCVCVCVSIDVMNFRIALWTCIFLHGSFYACYELPFIHSKLNCFGVSIFTLIPFILSLCKTLEGRKLWELNVDTIGCAHMRMCVRMCVSVSVSVCSMCSACLKLTDFMLNRARLTDFMLNRARLTDFMLNRARLTDFMLNRARLTDFMLNRARLTDYMLNRARLTDFMLNRARLTDFMLNRARLTDCMLNRARLTDCMLNRARLTDFMLNRARAARGFSWWRFCEIYIWTLRLLGKVAFLFNFDCTFMMWASLPSTW